MSILKEWFDNTGYQLFKEASQLSIEQSKHDTEEKPYKSKYKSREILEELKSKIETFFNDESNKASLVRHLAVLYYELGVNYFECEEVGSGEQYLKKCLELLENEEKSKFSSLFIAANNQLACIWSSRSSHDKAYECLLKSDIIYKQKCNKNLDNKKNATNKNLEDINNLANEILDDNKDIGIMESKIIDNETEYLDENKDVESYDYRNVWKSSDEKSDKQDGLVFFEGLYTYTFYYMAQVLGYLGNSKEASRCCHITLSRQMNSKEYDPLDWSLCCATLSQFYITSDEYTMARFCLSCSQFINKQAFIKFENADFSDDSEKSHAKEKVKKSRADIQRCWGKYGLNLLKSSHERLISEANSEMDLLNIKKLDISPMEFGSLNVTSIEVEMVTDNLVSNYSEAKDLFTFSNNCLQKAKEFYVLDGYVSDFTEITQDLSQLFRYFAFFDDNFENRCKMHKRRIDMLSPVLSELNPKYFLQISKQLIFETAECFTEMVDLKRKILEESPDKRNVKSLRKLNSLILQSMAFYNRFVDTYKTDGILPSKFEEDDVRGVLMCYFCMARLNSKYLTNDKEIKLEYLRKEKACYEFILNYNERNPDMPKVFEEELQVSKEMLGLFDTKLNNVMSAMI